MTLTRQEKQHVWFSDGSAKYTGSTHYWKEVAYNLVTTKSLTTTGEGKSSQFAKFYAVCQVLKKINLTECHVYIDSWLVANG